MQRMHAPGKAERLAAVLALAVVIVLATCAVAFAGDNIVSAEPLPTTLPFAVTLDGNASAEGTSAVYYVDVQAGDAITAGGTDAAGFIFLVYGPTAVDIHASLPEEWAWADWEDLYYTAPAAGRYYLRVWAPQAGVSNFQAASGTLNVTAGILKKTSFNRDPEDVASQIVAFDGGVWFAADLFEGASGSPMGGRRITVTRQFVGGKVEKVGTIYTDTEGYCEYVPFSGPFRKATYTMQFDGTGLDTIGMGWAPSYVQKTITPRALISMPVNSSSSPTHGRTFSTSGWLAPRHTVGGYGAKLEYYRYESGRWRLRKTVTAKDVSNSSTYTYQGYPACKYSVSLTLPYAGKWKVRAIHSDADHASTATGYRSFTVR